jgi:5-formyltetrahydrofolate cyclo-ligase
MPQRETKQQLRKSMRAVLSNLDKRWVKAASGRVCEHLSTFVKEAGSVDHVLAWGSFFAGEVDLSGFIETQLDAGRLVYLPQTRPDRSMQFICINQAWMQGNGLGDSVVGLGGVPEPKSEVGSVFDPHNAASTVVVVPGLAFDQRGGRLGRGLGFYDLFLGRSLMHRARTVAAGWELQLVPEVPMASHDHSVHALATEERLRLFVEVESD